MRVYFRDYAMTRAYSGVIKLTACLYEGWCEAVKMYGIKKKEESNIAIIVIVKGMNCEVMKFYKYCE
jgi:hypothetical protein